MRLLVTHSDLNEQDCIVADLVEDLRAMDAIDLCIETELKTGSEGT